MFATTFFSRTYQYIAKPLFFLIDPETMHTCFGKIGHRLGKQTLTRNITRFFFSYKHPSLEQTYAWVTFTNPVGLAAGFDKDLQLCHIISDVWFGYSEVWSITAEPYGGNPAPRLYRLKKSQWLIVYYWLKNNGIIRAIQRYTTYKHIHIPVVVSIAKTNCARTVDVSEGQKDYITCLQACEIAHIGDIYELNISCPNAFGGENFAHPTLLRHLLEEVQTLSLTKPIFVKLPVDSEREQLQELLDICIAYHVTWVVISNLTKQRDGLVEKEDVTHIPGGISGKPTVQKSNELIGKAYLHSQNKILIVGLWWIFNAENAYEKIKQGASLVQLITWMIFQWPQLIWQINAWLVALMQKDGYTHISQVIWSAHLPHA